MPLASTGIQHFGAWQFGGLPTARPPAAPPPPVKLSAPSGYTGNMLAHYMPQDAYEVWNTGTTGGAAGGTAKTDTTTKTNTGQPDWIGELLAMLSPTKGAGFDQITTSTMPFSWS